MVKILAFCISTNYAIFGIMKLYGDDTIDQMVMIFFEILKEWSFDSYSAYKNFLPILSNAFNSILRFLPELIENYENFAVVLNFYKNSLIKLRDFHSEFAVKDKEVHSNFTSLLRYLVKNQVFQVWTGFRPHLLVLLNTLFDTYSKVVDSIYVPLFLIAKYDLEYLASCFSIDLRIIRRRF